MEFDSGSFSIEGTLGSFLVGCSGFTSVDSPVANASSSLLVADLVLAAGIVADSASVDDSPFSEGDRMGRSILTGSSSTKRETGGGPRSGESPMLSVASEHIARISSRLSSTRLLASSRPIISIKLVRDLLQRLAWIWLRLPDRRQSTLLVCHSLDIYRVPPSPLGAATTEA